MQLPQVIDLHQAAARCERADKRLFSSRIYKGAVLSCSSAVPASVILSANLPASQHLTPSSDQRDDNNKEWFDTLCSFQCSSVKFIVQKSGQDWILFHMILNTMI